MCYNPNCYSCETNLICFDIFLYMSKTISKFSCSNQCITRTADSLVKVNSTYMKHKV